MSKNKSLYNYLLSIIIGFVSSYAFAPTYWLLLIFITFPIFMRMLYKSKSYRKSFFIGWSFGFGYFLGGLYWISYSLLVDNKLFGWLIPFAIIFIPLILALYIGVLGIIVHKLKPQNGSTTGFAVLFVCLWTLFEIIRTNLFTGFPWLALGYSLSRSTVMLQSASIGGVFLLSFILLCSISVIFVIANSAFNKGSLKLPIIAICAFISLPIINYIYGKYRLQNANVEFTKYHIRIVQPNISQHLKWSAQQQYKNLLKTIALTSESLKDNNYIIWPESATSTYPLNKEETRNLVKKAIPKNSYLISGGLKYGKNLEVWNSIFVIDHEGKVVDSYDKIHLVPFGEYIPYRKFLPFSINKITHGLSDFSPGTTVKVIKIKDLPSFRPLICYESFFPKEILNKKSGIPKLLINFTNDAWYGNSPGPYQHLDMTILRSIEYGIPIIRAANTGISAITDPYGRYLHSLPLNKEGVIDEKIPFPIAYSTIYSINGDYTLFIILFFLLIINLTVNRAFCV